MLSIVFVDWDGTAVRSKRVYHESMVKVFKKHGVIPPDIVTFGNEISAAKTFQEFYEKFGLPGIQESEDATIREPYVESNWHRIVPTEGFASFLQTCNAIGVSVVILSNNSDRVIGRKLQELNLRKYVNRIAGVQDKADYLGNLIALEGYSPAELVHIDDTKEGLMAAKLYGVRTIAFTDGFNSKEKLRKANPDFPEHRNGTLSDVDDFFKVTEIIYRMHQIQKERV